MKGYSSRETPLGWKVFRVHYSADPDKDPARNGKEWYAHARKGIKERDWRKEYEIDYRALGGQLVWPEFDPTIHVTEHRFPLDKGYWTVYHGADPHPRRAHAHVWLAVNRDGGMVVPWSWWPEALNMERSESGKARLTVSDYAESLRDIENAPLGLRSYLAVMDQAGKNFDAEEGVDYFQKYLENNIHFYPAKKNRDLSGIDALSEVLKLKETDAGPQPTLTIWAGMGDNDELAEQIRVLRFQEFRGNVPDKDPPAKPQEIRRHLVDALMYILLYGPEFIDQERSGLSLFEPIYPSLGY
jgi:hypothetical protein